VVLLLLLWCWASGQLAARLEARLQSHRCVCWLGGRSGITLWPLLLRTCKHPAAAPTTPATRITCTDCSITWRHATHTTACTVALQDDEGRLQPLAPVTLPGGMQVTPQPWLNLDGDLAPVCLSLLPLLVSEDPGERACLTWLGAAFRLFSSLEMAMMGELTNIDALLGCPVAMFPDDLVKVGAAGCCLGVQL
jgi:hypothetical protein